MELALKELTMVIHTIGCTDVKHAHCVPHSGSSVRECSDGPQNLGLWIDALNFIVITLQIIIFDTQYAEVVKTELNRKVEEAQS